MQRHRLARIAMVMLLAAVAACGPDVQRIVVAAGDDPPPLHIATDGARLIEIDRAGTLLVHVGDRVMRQPQPRAYQDINGRRRIVAVHFDIASAGAPRMILGSYDRAFPLVIESQPSQRQ